MKGWAWVLSAEMQIFWTENVTCQPVLRVFSLVFTSWLLAIHSFLLPVSLLKQVPKATFSCVLVIKWGRLLER